MGASGFSVKWKRGKNCKFLLKIWTVSSKYGCCNQGWMYKILNVQFGKNKKKAHGNLEGFQSGLVQKARLENKNLYPTTSSSNAKINKKFYSPFLKVLLSQRCVYWGGASILNVIFSLLHQRNSYQCPFSSALRSLLCMHTLRRSLPKQESIR